MKFEKDLQIFGLDVETTPFVEGETPKFLFGCVFGKNEKFVFRNIEDFWRFVAGLKKPAVFVCHNLAYDFYFLIQKMPPYKQVNIQYLNKPSFVSIVKRKGEKRIRVFFVDTQNFYGKYSLSYLAGVFCPDVPKLEVNVEQIDPWNAEYIRYCMRDAEICYRLYKVVFDRFGFGISLPNIAGRWLKRLLHLDPSGRNDEVKRAERESYFGGHVDVFRFVSEFDGVQIDVNSLYPFVMTKPLPRKFVRELTAGEVQNFNLTYSDKFAYLINCEVEIVGRRGVLPKKIRGVQVYPVGKFSGWYWEHALIFAKKYGYLKSLKIKRVLVYEKTDAHIEAIKRKYQERLNARDESEKMLIKLFLNSSYGKLAERERESLSFTVEEFEREFGDLDVVEDKVEYPHPKSDEVCVWDVRRYPSVVQLERKLDTEKRGAFTAVSSYITSLAFTYLNVQLERAGDDCFACDTDSLFLTRAGFEVFREEINNQLGGFKIEAEGRFTIWCPKFYTVQAGGKVIEKTKGVPKTKFANTQVVEENTHFRIYEYRHLLKPREAEKRKLQPYSVIKMRKEIFGQLRFAKGYVFADGQVEPLRIVENSPVEVFIHPKCVNREFLKKFYRGGKIEQ